MSVYSILRTKDHWMTSATELIGHVCVCLFSVSLGGLDLVFAELYCFVTVITMTHILSANCTGNPALRKIRPGKDRLPPPGLAVPRRARVKV